MLLLLVIWMVSLAILIGYHTFVFRKPVEIKNGEAPVSWPGVSMVIAVKNGSRLAERHIPALLNQDYPEFEIIMVDDHSEEGEFAKLQNLAEYNSRVTAIQSVKAPGKRNALVTGIEQAKFPLILCTDVDCRPVSPNWIKSMVKSCQVHEMVIGYSPYQKQPGLLNLWVRFETVMTGMQYLSWAAVGKPYMGVGRNLMFTKDWFQRTLPFQGASQVPYGDDDRLVQLAAKNGRVTANLDRDAFVLSIPVQHWSEWWRQKHRHLSAGHQYTGTHWLKPGVYGMALTLQWWLLPFHSGYMWPWVWVLFIGGLSIRWLRHVQWTQLLGEKDSRIFYPVLEAGYTLYLAVMGIFTWFKPKERWS